MSRASMADVARLAGVSKNTVSLALRGDPRVAEATRQRVAEAAREIGYRLNPTVAHLMAELRQNRAPGFQATLALVNANEGRDAFRLHPTIPSYVEGCLERGRQLGYRFDEFWLHDPELTAERWRSIFRARSIRGILLVGLMRSNRLPDHFEPLLQEFPAVVTGVRTRDPELSFVCSDHHALALTAFERAIGLGYQRPGLVLDGVIDRLIEGRFTAGYLTGQSRLCGADARIEPFLDVEGARRDRAGFLSWLETNRPDLIFTLYHEVEDWLREAGIRVPEEVGLVQYEWRDSHREWSGMNQRNDLVGVAAVDMLVSMIHHHECGVPEHPRATLIGSQWVTGSTTRGPGA